jgi:deazaflavin-dependent oxidoreductase (nitroreductase family)
MSASRPYIKPGGFTKLMNDLLARLGVTTTLAVRGRKSGEWRTAGVFVLERDGTRYLIAPRGDTQWARNLRVAGGGELRRRGRVERFRAAEVPDEEKPELVKAYVDRYGSIVRSEFSRLPNPLDHPVFRLQMVQ